MTQHSDLPVQNSFITTHTENGESVFLPESDGIPETLNFKSIGPTPSRFADLHAAPSVPVNLTEDISESHAEIWNNTVAQHVNTNGTVFRRTDMPPGGASPMHRTTTLDYGVVVAGSVELTLESGEKRVLKQGDTVVQRATMHMWRNMSQEEWCRVVWVMLPIQDFEVNGKKLEDEFRRPGQ